MILFAMPYLIMFLMAFIICATLLEFLLKSNIGQRILDQPNERSLHSKPIPRVGGIALVGSVTVSVTVWISILSPVMLRANFSFWLLAPILLLALISFFDDKNNLHPGLRLVIHGLAALLLLLMLPDYLKFAWPPFEQVNGLLLGKIGIFIFTIIWAINSFNFMDGADGLAGGMALIGFGTYAMAALPSALPSDLVMMAVVIAGASLGFLLFNFPPARVFMGDAGSIPLGFLAAALGIYGMKSAVWPAWFPVLVFSPFLVDASVTLCRRIGRREKFWLPHRQHYYQRLILSGWSHRRTTLAYYVVMLAGAVSALYARKLFDPLPILGLWVIAYSLLLICLERYLQAHKNNSNQQ